MNAGYQCFLVFAVDMSNNKNSLHWQMLSFKTETTSTFKTKFRERHVWDTLRFQDYDMCPHLKMSWSLHVFVAGARHKYQRYFLEITIASKSTWFYTLPNLHCAAPNFSVHHVLDNNINSYLCDWDTNPEIPHRKDTNYMQHNLICLSNISCASVLGGSACNTHTAAGLNKHDIVDVSLRKHVKRHPRNKHPHNSVIRIPCCRRKKINSTIPRTSDHPPSHAPGTRTSYDAFYFYNHRSSHCNIERLIGNL